MSQNLANPVYSETEDSDIVEQAEETMEEMEEMEEMEMEELPTLGIQINFSKIQNTLKHTRTKSKFKLPSV